MNCPHCASPGKKKGIRNGSQRFVCYECGKWYSDRFEAHDENDITPSKVFRMETTGTVRIHGLTDVHVGAHGFDRKMFNRAVREIEKDEGARWFGNGDMVELIPPNYKISQRGQYAEPDDQVLEFLKLIKPIKDKCLFLRGGNHDMLRSVNLLGVDVCKLMAREMGVPYAPFPSYAEISVNGISWKMASGHGKSGAQNGDLELKRMADIYSEAHVLFLGHNHQLYAKPMDSLRVNGCEESLFRRWFIRGGSFLRYPEYSRYAFFPVVRTGWVTMEFREDDIECWTN